MGIRSWGRATVSLPLLSRWDGAAVGGVLSLLSRAYKPDSSGAWDVTHVNLRPMACGRCACWSTPSDERPTSRRTARTRAGPGRVWRSPLGLQQLAEEADGPPVGIGRGRLRYSPRGSQLTRLRWLHASRARVGLWAARPPSGCQPPMHRANRLNRRAILSLGGGVIRRAIRLGRPVP